MTTIDQIKNTNKQLSAILCNDIIACINKKCSLPKNGFQLKGTQKLINKVREKITTLVLEGAGRTHFRGKMIRLRFRCLKGHYPRNSWHREDVPQIVVDVFEKRSLSHFHKEPIFFVQQRSLLKPQYFDFTSSFHRKQDRFTTCFKTCGTGLFII